jgi:hypothetical protein
MISELVDLLHNFLGDANHTWCFAHIINLVVKSLLKQFEVPKKKADEVLSKAEWAMVELAEGIDLEELETRLQIQKEGDESDDDDDDDEGLEQPRQHKADQRDGVLGWLKPIPEISLSLSLLIGGFSGSPDSPASALKFQSFQPREPIHIFQVMFFIQSLNRYDSEG